MKQKTLKYLESLLVRYPLLANCEDSIIRSYELLEECFFNGNKLLIAGNGGSAADADHIVGELMKEFKLPRKCSKVFKDKLIETDSLLGEKIAEALQSGLPAIALHNHTCLNTAYANDINEGSLYAYAQQLYVYGRKGDVFLGISTSGNSKNVINTAIVAKTLGIKVIGLTGKHGGELAKLSDITIKVPETDTFLIQEYHIPIYHCLCLMLEEEFFGDIII